MENEEQHGHEESLEQRENCVNDSQPGDPTIKETLLNINENMGKMAEMLQMLYHQPLSEDYDRPTGSKRRRRSSDSRSADEDEPRGKKQRNNTVNEEDQLSVDAASDIDSDVRLLIRESDAHPQVNDQGDIDESLLKS